VEPERSLEGLSVYKSRLFGIIQRGLEMFIYLIVNHVTGKYYVGQHKGKNLQRYLGQKLSGAMAGLYPNTYLFRSMRKHPKEAWSIHALLSDVQTKTELDQYEKDFIEFLRARVSEYGYNICRGGEGFTGPHTSSTRKRISIGSKRVWASLSAAEREDRGKKLEGHYVSPLRIAALIARNKLGPSPQTLQNLRDSHLGVGRSEASCEKQSQSVTGEKNHFYGKHHSEATLALLRGNGSRTGAKGRHARWHVARKIIDPTCTFCEASGLSDSL
jgi:hypothetical protein